MAAGAPEQGCYRSAISRGYYAVFLQIKRELVERNFDFPEHSAHGRTLAALRATNIRHLGRIARRLERLRAVREDADYNLDRTFTKTEVEDVLERCIKLQKELVDSVPNDAFLRLGAYIN